MPTTEEWNQRIIWSRTFTEASEYAADQDWWLHSWLWQEWPGELAVTPFTWCSGWRSKGWYCNGGHPIDTPQGTHACPTWPSGWRHPVWYLRMR